MKRTAMQHTKMNRLMRILKIPRYAAVGILESLWHLTAREAPAGNVGKLSNEDIAACLDWEGDADDLVNGFIQGGWIDANEAYRLIVHDWHEHADDATDNLLARSGQTYANGKIPEMKRLSKTEREHISAQYANKSHPVQTQAHSVPTESALPLPLPLPEPKPSKKQKPSRDKRESDPRHEGFKAAVMSYGAFKHVKLAWDGSEAKQLAALLDSAPNLTLKEFQECLKARARSPGTPHGDRPRVWLPNILRYQQGPLNEFNRTGETNAKSSRTEQVIDSSLGALALLERMDHAENRAGPDAQSGRADRRLLEGVHGQAVATHG